MLHENLRALEKNPLLKTTGNKKQGPLTKYWAQLIHLAATPCLHGCTPNDTSWAKDSFPAKGRIEGDNVMRASYRHHGLNI